MKKLIVSTLAVAMMSSSAFAASNEGSSVCRGEFGDHIIESIQSCSEVDLARSQVEIGKLEEEMAKAEAEIESIYNTPGRDGISANTIVKIQNYALLTLSLSGSFALWISPSKAQPYYRYEAQLEKVKTLRLASIITAGMAAVALYASDKLNERFIEVDGKALSDLKSLIGLLKKEIQARKTLLDVANKIKQEQKH